MSQQVPAAPCQRGRAGDGARRWGSQGTASSTCGHPATGHGPATPAISLGSRAGAIKPLSESTSASGSEGQAKQSPPGLSSPIPEPRKETKPPRSRACSRSAAAPGQLCRGAQPELHAQESAAGGSVWLEGARAELRQGHRCTDTAGHYSSLLLGKNKAETLLGKWELSPSPRFCGQPAVAPRPSPALVGYPKTLLGDAKQRGKRPPCCTHTGKARGKSDRGRGLA